MRRFALQQILNSLSRDLANKSLKENFISNMHKSSITFKFHSQFYFSHS